MAGQTANYLFDYPTSTDYVKDGATAIETLADDVDATLFTALGGAYPGLRLVKKQTIGTAVSSIVVTDAFSSTYDNYKIIITGGVGSAADNFLSMKLGSTTTEYYQSRIGLTFTGTTDNGNDNNASQWTVVARINPNMIMSSFDLLAPYLSSWTAFYGGNSSVGSAGIVSGLQKSTTSFTGFTLTPGAGTVTGGTIYVYGYGKS